MGIVEEEEELLREPSRGQMWGKKGRNEKLEGIVGIGMRRLAGQQAVAHHNR